MRISLSGTYSTGKTTLAEACHPVLASRFGDAFAYVREVARGVIARGFPLDRAATIDSYVVYVQSQLEAERRAAADHVMSDRSLIDLLAYVRFSDAELVPPYVGSMLEEVVWREIEYFDVYCYLPIEFAMEVDDVRTADESYRAAVDRALVELFSAYGVRVETVTGTLEERRDRVLGLFGV